MKRQWRTMRFWNVAVAESRGAIKWQTFQGRNVLRTRLGKIYDTKLLAGCLAIREAWSIVD